MNTVQDTDDVSQNCTPETYIIVLTNVTPINSIKNLKILPIVHIEKKSERKWSVCAGSVPSQVPGDEHLKNSGDATNDADEAE